MLPRRRTDPASGRAALDAWLADQSAASRETQATAVRFALEELSSLAPGGATEVRVPPFGVVQCMAGPRHTRGTPPNIVEMQPATWLRLATGQTEWAVEVAEGRVRASGERSDLSELLPLFDTLGQ